ncbi:MAG: hypothetical protein TU35_006860 [Thermoproteus sp. AZ2]|jgi:hypothetical protein|uniref:Uncharacterized protein n=1 Tax=Thermoproteus sp. AZ2 TaxID=1609232 RepID=A0ACC6V1Y3_9CREN
MNKAVLIAIAVAAVVAAAAYFAYAQTSPQSTQTATVTVTVWKTPPSAPYASNCTQRPSHYGYWGGRRPVAALRTPTSTTSPLAAERLAISLTSSQVSLTLNATALTRGGGAAAVVEGQGVLTIGGQQYQIQAVDGAVLGQAFALRIYTGNALVLVEYARGRIGPWSSP